VTDAVETAFAKVEEALAKYDPEHLEVPPDCQPVDFNLMVMRDHRQPMQRRMKAAEAAAAYVHPKLSAMAVSTMTAEDFAARLERAIQRSMNPPPRLNDPPLIEAQPERNGNGS
jgi:hypothetical protein